ncbi:MAG: SEL1-like repeat protein [Clostridia bacterium]|nr:SEL1-like repeat protein [Clostridia bacterium]
MSKQCPKCGVAVSDTAKFCRACGSKIEAAKPAEKAVFCPECGTKCTADDRFCESCGFDLRAEETPAAAPTAPVRPAVSYGPALDLFKRGMWDKAVSALAPMVQADDPKALWLTGICYDMKCVDNLDDKIFACHQRAAARGLTEAKANLAECYWLGVGVEADEKESERLFGEVLATGNSYAMYKYGVYLTENTDRYEEALEWYTRAAEAGEPLAARELVDHYSYEEEEKAAEWAQKLMAIKASDSPEDPVGAVHDSDLAVALHAVAEKLEHGKDLKKDLPQAIANIERALALTNNSYYGDCLKKLRQSSPKKSSVSKQASPKKADAVDEWGSIGDFADEWGSVAPANDQKGTKVDAIDDGWGEVKTADATDEWGSALESLKRFEENDIFADFEYKKTPRGEIVIVKLKNEYALDVTVPAGATVIGDGAFAGCAALTAALPDGLTTIGRRAFADCANLEKLVLPASVRIIGEEAFDGSEKLEVALPRTVHLGKNALRGTRNEQKEHQMKDVAKKQSHEKAVEFYNSCKYAEALPLLLPFAGEGNADDLERIAYCYQNANKWTEAVSYYQKAVAKDNPWAQYRLAMCYRWGNGVEQNAATAFNYFKMGAMQGHVWSQVELSECYKYGNGCEKNLSEAIKWAGEAAKAGDANGQLYYGEYFYFGNGTAQDFAEAFKWFTLSAKGGCAHGQYLLGECYKYGQGTAKDLAAAVKWYEAADKQGSSCAQHALGCLYREGSGVKQDAAKAVELFRRSANGGRSFAMYDLAECCRKGEGTAVNKAEALRWYQKAAEVGDAWMKCRLAEIYRGGHCDKKDEAAARKWYHAAADGGNTWSLVMLGDCYRDGIGGNKDEAEAFKWYKKAADAGEAWGQFHTANRLFEGLGCEKNAAEGLRYMLLAGEQGNEWAADQLRWRYQCGKDIEKNDAEAFKWAKKRMEIKRDGWGLCVMGDYYANGWGTQKDEAKALELYRAAAELGYANAQYNVGDYYLHGKGGLPVDKLKAIEWLMKAAANGQNHAAEILNSLQ